MKKIAFTIGLSLASTALYAGSCDVTVTWPSGKPHSGARVTGEVNMGGMTDPTYTDKHGHATIVWSSKHSLASVFVNGNRHGGCRNGGSIHVVED